ncbi:MAG: hypothetical protein ACOX1O_06180 [Eggerthellaceae bacterium]|jgi:hypothetical protein
MKALTVTPRDAMLLLLDRKWVVCQQTRTDFRGPVVICADAQPLQAATIPGMALCVVNLSDIEPFSEDHLEAAGMRHMPKNGWFAWIFDDLDWIKPFPLPADAKGPEDGLFDLNGKLVDRLPLEMDSKQALRTYYEPLIRWSDSHQSEAETRSWWEGELNQF